MCAPLDGSSSPGGSPASSDRLHPPATLPAHPNCNLAGSWDPDKDGVLEISELKKQLRPGGAVRLASRLKPGAAGEIVLDKHRQQLQRQRAGLNQEQAASAVQAATFILPVGRATHF